MLLVTLEATVRTSNAVMQLMLRQITADISSRNFSRLVILCSVNFFSVTMSNREFIKKILKRQRRVGTALI